MAWGAAAAAIPVAVNAITGGGSRRRKDLQRAIAELRGSQPQGYITPQDEAVAERRRGKGVEEAGQTYAQNTSAMRTRQLQTGITGPAAERGYGRSQQIYSLARQRAGEGAQGLLDEIRLGREGFERQKALAIFGARTGDAQNEQRRADLRESTFANSLLEFMPAILGGYGAEVPQTDISQSQDDWNKYLPDYQGSALPDLPGENDWGRPAPPPPRPEDYALGRR